MKQNSKKGMQLAAHEIIKWGVGFAVSFAVLGLCIMLYGKAANTNTSNALNNGDASTYAATTQGFGGDVTAEITVSGGTITNVKLTGDNETPTIGGAALESLQQQVLDAQGAGIDGVSGASLTSGAVKDAVAKALAQAGIVPAETGNKAADGDNFIPGTYVGVANGFGGDLVVKVVVDNQNIKSIDVIENHETVNIGSFAVEMQPEKMVAAQTVKVDALSGATVSSNGIKSAVTKALKEAGADIDAMPTAAKETIPTDQKAKQALDYDVVVIGAGGAGMTAAITAKQAGMNVVILEKMPYVGGNTTRASGGMNAAGTKMQEKFLETLTDEKKIESLKDSTVENFITDTMNSGHNINDEALVRTMAEESSGAIDWLESIGAPLPEIAATGSTVHMYLHEPEDGSAVGEFLVKFYSGKLKEMDIPVMLNTKATELVKSGDTVTAVIAEDDETVYTINAKAVILATGGFGGNKDMLVKYDSTLGNTVSTNAAGITGDGIVMAEAINAALVDVEQIQLHPTVFSSGMLVSERVRSNGAILVNKSGQRFVNDLAGRDTVSQAELKQEDGCAYIVYDAQFADQSLYTKYAKLGMVISGNTVEELAANIGFDETAAKNFMETVDKWNDTVKNGTEDEFGRNNGLEPLAQAPFYAIQIAPGIHHTMGGVKINTEAQVIDTNGNAIPGLFAAGEVTGGVHGGNRVGGNAVADIVVFGRIAGANASEFAANN